MADWIKIRNEYISTDISYRNLSKKHKVSFATLQVRAKREEWQRLRDEQYDSVQTAVRQKTVETLSDDAASYAAALARISGKAMRLVEKSVDTLLEKADPYKIKVIVSALKDLRDMAKSDEREVTDIEDLTPLAQLLKDGQNEQVE